MGLVWPYLVQAASDERAAPTDRIFELDFQKSLRVLNFFELVVEFSVKLNVIFPMSPWCAFLSRGEAQTAACSFQKAAHFWFTQRRVWDSPFKGPCFDYYSFTICQFWYILIRLTFSTCNFSQHSHCLLCLPYGSAVGQSKLPLANLG